MMVGSSGTTAATDSIIISGIWQRAVIRLASGLTTSGSIESQVDRLHDNLMLAPYDYRIGTAGDGLFDASPDRTIANSGRLNCATSLGGYMRGTLRSPYGYWGQIAQQTPPHENAGTRDSGASNSVPGRVT
jgi:hypothetical protein